MTVLTISVLAQFFTVIYDTLVFRTDSILGANEDGIPQIWSLVTCVSFESSIFFLLLHLLILNYLVNQLENVWSRGSFLAIVFFSAFWTSLLRFLTQLTISAIIQNPNDALSVPYCSINHLIIIVLMGCR